MIRILISVLAVVVAVLAVVLKLLLLYAIAAVLLLIVAILWFRVLQQRHRETACFGTSQGLGRRDRYVALVYCQRLCPLLEVK